MMCVCICNSMALSVYVELFVAWIDDMKLQKPMDEFACVLSQLSIYHIYAYNMSQACTIIIYPSIKYKHTVLLFLIKC